MGDGRTESEVAGKRRLQPPGWVSARLVAELGIIFVGVFGAFIAEDVRQQREDDQRAQQIYRAVRSEISAYADRAPHVTNEMQERLDEWSAQHSGGAFPPSPYYREPRAETPPTAIWTATLASGGVALLDPALFNELAEFYNRLQSVSNRYLRYNAITERDVLPNLDAPASHFYTEDGELRGLYRTHMMLLEEILEELKLLTVDAAEVDAALAGAIQQ